MEKIYSKINGQLLHQIVRIGDVISGRTDLSSDENYLQCAALNLPKGLYFIDVLLQSGNHETLQVIIL